MLNKTFTPKKTVCKVKFSIPKDWAKKKVVLVGDFNDWKLDTDQLKEKKDAWEIELRLKPESTYRFKYYIDDERWENDENADEYVSNNFGTEDSIVHTSF